MARTIRDFCHGITDKANWERAEVRSITVLLPFR